MRVIYLGLVGSVMLSGCTTPVQEPAGEQTSPISQNETCAAEAFSRYLWQPKEILDGVTLPEGARVIGPDTAVTLDFRQDRLNVAIGKSERIERVYCG